MFIVVHLGPVGSLTSWKSLKGSMVVRDTLFPIRSYESRCKRRRERPDWATLRLTRLRTSPRASAALELRRPEKTKHLQYGLGTRIPTTFSHALVRLNIVLLMPLSADFQH